MYGVQLPNHFSMGSEVEREGILECQLYADGLVVLTKGLQLWAVSGLQDPRPQKLANPKLKGPPSCMAIFEPRHTLSGCLEVCTHSWEPDDVSASAHIHQASVTDSALQQLDVMASAGTHNLLCG